MDALPSSEFRKRYATLVVPTEVTVNGHVIGMWVPSADHASKVFAEFLGRAEEGSVSRVPLHLDPTFNSRPFTPVPKRATRG